MPGVAGVAALERIAALALTTCAATCHAQILFMDNGGTDQRLRDRIRETCRITGHRYVWMDEPFNEARYFNLGAQMTGAEIVFRANFDVEFFPGWLDNLLDLWAKNPEYYCLAPYGYADQAMGLCCRRDTRPEAKIVDCDHPSGWMYGMRRAEMVPTDESFRYWNVDYDFYGWMRANSKRGGVCYNSRVDHLADAVKTHHPESFGFDLEKHKDEAHAAYQKKWNR